MIWVYRQSTGELFSQNGSLFARGYAGHGKGRNNPDEEATRNVGPLPRGRYSLRARTEARPTAYTVELRPETTLAGGRSGFLIHGDNPTGDASRGCIILGRTHRQHIWERLGTLIVIK